MKKWKQAIILGVMCLMLTIGIFLQIKTVKNNGNTVSSNKELNELKAQVLKMKEKYDNTYLLLEAAQKELETTRNKVTNNDEELKSLEEEIKKDNMLLGATEVKGQGVTITITDANVNSSISSTIDQSDLLVHDKDLLAVVNELKNAGAEAIEINGQRIVNTSAIICEGNVISVNGQKISSTFTINAIGLSTRLATLKRAGGYLERLEESYIRTSFNRVDKITISKYAGITNFKYAKTKE